MLPLRSWAEKWNGGKAYWARRGCLSLQWFSKGNSVKVYNWNDAFYLLPMPLFVLGS